MAQRTSNERFWAYIKQRVNAIMKRPDNYFNTMYLRRLQKMGRPLITTQTSWVGTCVKTISKVDAWPTTCYTMGVPEALLMHPIPDFSDYELDMVHEAISAYVTSCTNTSRLGDAREYSPSRTHQRTHWHGPVFPRIEQLLLSSRSYVQIVRIVAFGAYSPHR